MKLDGTSLDFFEPSPADVFIPRLVAKVALTLVPAGEEAAKKGVLFCVGMLSAKMPEDVYLKGYALILGDLPNDLLQTAIKSALSVADYHKLPPPGVFMNPVRSELDKRKRELKQLERHEWRVRFFYKTHPHPDITLFR